METTIEPSPQVPKTPTSGAACAQVTVAAVDNDGPEVVSLQWSLCLGEDIYGHRR